MKLRTPYPSANPINRPMARPTAKSGVTLLIAERSLARFGDFQRSDFEPRFAFQALAGLGSEANAHQLRQLVGRETVRPHDSRGTALAEPHPASSVSARRSYCFR